MPNQPPITLDDGLLRFTLVNRETGEATPHFADVTAVRLNCQECVETHHLQVSEEDSYLPTTAFYTDLRSRIAAIGLPDCSLTETDCTTSILQQLWGASVSGIETLKKNTDPTPNLPSGSESNPPETASESATSNSPAPEASPPTSASESGPT